MTPCPGVLHWPREIATDTCAFAASPRERTMRGVPLPLTIVPPRTVQVYVAPSIGATEAEALPERQPKSGRLTATFDEQDTSRVRGTSRCWLPCVSMTVIPSGATMRQESASSVSTI